MGPEEVLEEVEVAVASGFQTCQLLVMKWAPVYAAETGMLMGMLGGDVVKEAEAEVIGWFVWNEVEVDVLKFLPWKPGKGHEPEEEWYGSG